MQLANVPEDTEDPDHSPAQRAEAASRSTGVGVAVNRVLTTSRAGEARDRVMQRYRVLTLMAQVDARRRPDLDHAKVHPQPANSSAA